MSRPFKNPPEQYRETQTILELSWTVQDHQILLNHPDLTLPMEWQGVPPTNGRLGGTTCPIQQHTSMQRLPWSPSCSLTPTTSILDPLWATPTRHLQGWPASTCLRPDDLDMFRHAQECPDSSNCIQTPQVRPDHLGSLQITADQPQQYRNPWNDWMLKLENSRNSDTIQIIQYRGLGPPSWLKPTPGYVAHVCYLTTPKAPPETPCRTTLVWIRRLEWMIHTRGWKTPSWPNPIRKNPKTVRKPD